MASMHDFINTLYARVYIYVCVCVCKNHLMRNKANGQNVEEIGSKPGQERKIRRGVRLDKPPHFSLERNNDANIYKIKGGTGPHRSIKGRTEMLCVEG